MTAPGPDGQKSESVKAGQATSATPNAGAAEAAAKPGVAAAAVPANGDAAIAAQIQGARAGASNAPGDQVRDRARNAATGPDQAAKSAGKSSGSAQPQSAAAASSASATATAGAPGAMAASAQTTLGAGAFPGYAEPAQSPAQDGAARQDAAIRLEPAQGATAPERPAAAPPARTDAAAIVRLAQQIGQRAGEGQTRFEIRMDPPELGRVEVRLHIDGDNKAHATLLAERQDTLGDLSRAARSLERALEEAGLKLAQNGLEFGLKREGASGGGQGQHGAGGFSAEAPEDGLSAAETVLTGHAGREEPASAYGFRLARPRHIAVRV